MDGYGPALEPRFEGVALLDLLTSTLMLRCQNVSAQNPPMEVEIHLALNGQVLLVHGVERDPLEGMLSRWLTSSKRMLVQVSKRALLTTLGEDQLTQARLELHCTNIGDGDPSFDSRLCAGVEMRPQNPRAPVLIDLANRTIRFDVTHDLHAILADGGCAGWLIEAQLERFPHALSCQRA